MAKKPEAPKPIIWNVYKIAAKAIFHGVIEAPDEATAIEKAAAEFKVLATKLMAIRRRSQLDRASPTMILSRPAP